MWWLDKHIHYGTVSKIKIIKTSITSHSWHKFKSFCMVRMVKVYAQQLSSIQHCIIIVPMLYFRSSEFILITANLCPLTTCIIHFPLQLRETFWRSWHYAKFVEWLNIRTNNSFRFYSCGEANAHRWQPLWKK